MVSPARAVPGTSMKITGVRSSTRTTSSVAPGGRCCLAQPASNSTARSMWPCSRHWASNIGDLLGMPMYSMSVGTTLSAKVLSIWVRAAPASMLMAGVYRMGPERGSPRRHRRDGATLTP
jgi:hypothetical protein